MPGRLERDALCEGLCKVAEMPVRQIETLAAAVPYVPWGARFATREHAIACCYQCANDVTCNTSINFLSRSSCTCHRPGTEQRLACLTLLTGTSP
jgi:hypothetical protein